MTKKPTIAQDGYRPLTEGYQPLKKGYQPSGGPGPGQQPPKVPSGGSGAMKPNTPATPVAKNPTPQSK